MRGRMIGGISVLALLTASVGHAEVQASSEAGFVSHNEAEVAATPAEAWALLLRPSEWWSDAHTYSGSAGNMTIEAGVGGCFCEALPGSQGAPAGRIEHMRVIYFAPHSTLRMRGGLGPLQSEAVTGVLTVTIEPAASGSKIVWDYAVGGYMRMPMEQMAPLVDQVIGEQLASLAARLAES